MSTWLSNSCSVHGVGEYLLGPKKVTGDVRSEKTGSHRMLTPRDLSSGRDVWRRKLAWPIQVTLNPGLELSLSKAIVWIGASCARSGTGTNAGLSLANLVLSTDSNPSLSVVNDGQGFWNPVDGFPIW